MVPLMNMILTRFSIAFLCVAIFACDHHDADHGHDHDSGQEHEHETATKTGNLSLDAGRKWASDASTRAGMRRMQEIAQGASVQTGGPDANSALANELETELARLVRECTMQGPAHQMLHIYLVRVTETIEGLKSDDEAKAQTNRQRLKPLLNEFDEFFE